jgi:hypothetical protein
MSAQTKVKKTMTTLKQETYNLSDLKHDLHCGFKFVELGDSVSVSQLEHEDRDIHGPGTETLR